MNTLEKFTAILQKQLPGANVARQSLSRAPAIELALIEPNFNDKDLSQSIKNRLMEDPPYWIFCWASGHALAELLLNGAIDVEGKVVVDFGAGSGVGAIAAKLAGAKKVYACEICPVGQEVTALNAELNDVEIDIISDLRQAPDLDMLIAADVLYERSNYPFLDMFVHYTQDVVIADSRLKQMPNPAYSLWKTVSTTSFPDFNEALEFNEVKFYRYQED